MPETSNIPRRDQMTTADLQSVFQKVIEQTLKDICANPSESDSKPCQFFSRQPTTKSAKQKSAAVAAGACENVDTGASRRKKPARLSPPDESVNPPKRRKLSGRKEEEEPAGEELGDEVQRDKKEKKEKKEKNEKKKKDKETKPNQITKPGTFISARGCGGSPGTASDPGSSCNT